MTSESIKFDWVGSNYEKKYDAIFRRKRKRRENCAKTELESPSNDQFQQQIIQNDVKKNSEARYSTPGTFTGGMGLVTDLMTYFCDDVGDRFLKIYIFRHQLLVIHI